MKARMFEVKINLGNEAMQTPQDVVGALLRLAKTLGYLSVFDHGASKIMDINGNTVGSWRIT